jgi:iron complex outermembrane receptor protein
VTGFRVSGFGFRLALLWLLAFPVLADDEAPPAVLPQYDVHARTINESLTDPPVFVEVIDMAKFQGRFATTDEAVRQAVGVNVRDFGGLGQMSTISVRGSSSDQVVVLLDGVRLNPATGGGVDFASIPADHIARIEVIRGGDSALAGDGAVGGVVNLVTKKAAKGSATTLDATYGSFGTLRASAMRSQGFARGSYLVGANLLHTDGNFFYTSNNGTELDDGDDFRATRRNNGADSRGVLAKGTWRPSDSVDLAAQGEYAASRKGLPGMVTFPSPHASQEDQRATASLVAAFADAGAKGLSFRTEVAYRFSALDYDDPRGEQNAGVPTTTTRREHAPSVDETATYVWGTHQILTLGGTYRREMLDDPDFGDPARDGFAVTLRDQVLLWGQRITIVPAVRYDHVTGVGDQWSPKLGLHVRPVPWLAFKGNVSRSFRAPNFSELYLNQGFVEGNPDLKPETGWTYDGGAQVTTKWVDAEAAYFRSDLDDLIEYVLVSGFRYKPFNLSRAEIQGVELSASIHPLPWFEAAGSYTLTYAIDRAGEPNRDGRQIPGRPRDKGFARLALRYAPLAVYGEYHYIGGNYVTRAGTKLLPARNVVNAGVVLSPTENFRLGVDVKNLLDDEVTDVRGFPLPGRSVFATVGGTF